MKTFEFKSKDEWLNMRLADVTSTEVSALFGLNPYMTEFELWHQKKNQEIVLLENNDRMMWGTRLEPVIAQGIADDNGWKAQPLKIYGRDDTIRAGSSFDFKIETPEGTGILEIKNVDGLVFKNKWDVENGEVVDAPPHIELQIQQQLMITGYKFAYIGALVGGNKVSLIKRSSDAKIVARIRSKIIKFWEDIDNNNPPKPDFERDAEMLARLHGHAEPGKIMDVTSARIDALAENYKAASAAVKTYEAAKKAAKSELLTLIGEAEKVLGNGYTISAGVTGPKRVEAHERAGFRNFRIHFKKEKK